MDWLLLILGGLVSLGFVYTMHVAARPANRVRVLYLGKSHVNYVRFKPNPGFTLGKYHRCAKGNCPWRKKRVT